MDRDRPDVPDDASTGERVRGWRQFRRMSLADVARVSGVDRPHISRIETGKVRSVRDDTLRRLADALGCEVDDLSPAPVLTPRDRWNALRREVEQLPDDVADAFVSYVASFFPQTGGSPDRLFEIIGRSYERMELADSLRSAHIAGESGRSADDRAYHEWVRRQVERLDWSAADVLDLTYPTPRREARYAVVRTSTNTRPVEFYQILTNGQRIEWPSSPPDVAPEPIEVPVAAYPTEHQFAVVSESDIPGFPIHRNDILIVQKVAPTSAPEEGATVLAWWDGAPHVGRFRRDARERQIVAVGDRDLVIGRDAVSVTGVVVRVVTTRRETADAAAQPINKWGIVLAVMYSQGAYWRSVMERLGLKPKEESDGDSQPG